MILIALLAIGVGAGYVIGRIRPFDRLADWTEDQVRFHQARWDTPDRRACLIALLALTDPRRAIDAWKKSRSEKS